MSTTKYYTAYSPMSVNAYLSIAAGSATVHPELYYSLDGTNYLGDYDCPPQTLSGTSPKLYQWVISFPTITETSGFYIVRRFKVDTAGSSPNISFYIGTNTASGTNSGSHISFATPPTTDLGIRGGTNIVGGVTSGYDTATRTHTIGADIIAATGHTQPASSITNLPSPGCTTLTGTNFAITGATFAYNSTSTNRSTISVSATAPRYTYSLDILGTNAIDLAAGLQLRGTWTVTGTNVVTLVPYTGTVWNVYGRGL
jgi:hypothetical protein